MTKRLYHTVAVKRAQAMRLASVSSRSRANLISTLLQQGGIGTIARHENRFNGLPGKAFKRLVRLIGDLRFTSLKRGANEIELDEPEVAETARTDGADSAGRLLALDLGTRRVGVAVSDELRITVNPLQAIERRSWKDLLRRVAAFIESYDARGLVIGLPLSLAGAEGSAAKDARATAEKFQRSLSVPVYLQDERLTTFAATAQLKAAGRSDSEIEREVDSEAAALILGDFIASNRHIH